MIAPWITQREILLAAVGAAALRAAVDLAFYRLGSPDDMVWRLRFAVELIAFALPIILVSRGKLGLQWSSIVAIAAYWPTGFAFTAVNAFDWLDSASTASDQFSDPVAYYAASGVLMTVIAFLCIRGWFEFAEWSWQIRLWTTSGPLRWPIAAVTDAGTGAVVATNAWLWVPMLTPAMAIEPARDLVLLTSLALRTGAIGLLIASAAVDWARNRPGRVVGEVSGTSIADQRRRVCEQLGAEYVALPPAESLLVSGYATRSVIAAHGETSEGPRWLVVSGRIRSGKRLWRIPAGYFDAVRPDLSPFLGLPLGWVVTTAPPRAWFDPEVVRHVADAAERCEVADVPDDRVWLPVVALTDPG